MIDTLILSSLPIARRKLLLARILALTVFFAAILLGTSILGIIFLPLISELPGDAMRQLFSHAVAVLMDGLCASSLLIALHGILICGLGQRTARKLSPLIQAACVLVLLATLLLFPLLAHFLKPVLQAHLAATLWFPPFWFLGMYEILLHGSKAPALFSTLAHVGVVTTIVAVALAAVTYPIAYARRVRQTLEGIGGRQQRSRWSLFSRLLSASTLRCPRLRAINFWLAQTIWRTQSARMVLAAFGGFGFATIAGAVIAIHTDPGGRLPSLSPSAARIAIPMTAFWTIAGLRTAMRIPVSQPVAWAFRIIHGRPKPVHLLAVQKWVQAYAVIVVCIIAALLLIFTPTVRGGMDIAALCLLAVASPVLLSEAFFLMERTIPFTQAPPYSVNELSYAVVVYLVCFPLFCYAAATLEPWMAATSSHLILAFFTSISAYAVLCFLRQRLLRHDLLRIDMEDNLTLLPGEIGLRG